MTLEFAEAAAERDLLFGCQMLPTEHKHRFIGIGLFELLERRSVDTASDVEAGDLVAERRVGGFDLEGLAHFQRTVRRS